MTRVALITGASSGIGDATAKAFADAGYNVLAVGRNAERLQAVVAHAPDRITPIVQDLTGPEVCAELIDHAVQKFGRLDVLVNNAGIISRTTAEDTTDTIWRQTMTVNLDVPFYLSRAAVPHLRNTKGRIINVASDWGLSGGEKAAAYCASKGGLVLLTKAMARDHAADGITVNAVCPGDVVTPMLEKEAADQGMTHQEALQAWKADVPTGRLTEAGEVAAMILYLASDVAAQVTGTAMLIDGGGSA
ncbi:SDR family NAD(P)-dependent oxidoreductase [Kordiimonas lacus]|uniref:NAD(P)-dependent dehydrogenase, short-chain alcohol dehydrogenase family n=1 Tax=Kordiimonas lacus TaxID=637679 RepID=A0A1G6TMU0_9PROT|nr:SDR family oxidoreductase [Kordiimonas lacus]SDD29655.1 NAD(P)-dependent dehydrogenase, short-chain alcohol dehydrogenase family [Kordiimonas lacus]